MLRIIIIDDALTKNAYFSYPNPYLCVQYVSNMDETPAGLGGKDNSWRRLSLAALPRHSALANLVSFLEERGRGRESLGLLTASLTQPSQREQVATIKTVSSHR